MVYRNYVYLCVDIYINIWVVLTFRALVYGHVSTYTQYTFIYLSRCHVCALGDTQTHTHTGAYLHSVGRRVLCRICTQTAGVLHWLWASKGSVTTRFSVHGKRTNVTAVGTGLAWCIFLCEELNLLDSDTLQRRACCMVQFHSSCHMFWHILDHRYHKLHHVCTGLLKEVKRNKICILHRASQRNLLICLLSFYCKYQKAHFGMTII